MTVVKSKRKESVMLFYHLALEIRKNLTFRILKDSGKVIYTQTQKGLRREKRRLYKLRYKYDLGLIPASDIDNAFKSWCGNVYKNYPHTSYFRLKYIKRLYNQLFGDLLL